tara:strand:+ start:686 stop:1258 length:573 start_codon:yes stop_codon:yes gene_type:complete
MKITELQLRQIIHEEAQSILEADGYLSKAVDYGTALSQPQDLRFGKGIASSKTSTEGDNIPHWPAVNKALNIIFEELSTLHNSSKRYQQDRGFFAMIRSLASKIEEHPKLELTEVEYRYAEGLWEDVMSLAKYILNRMPESAEIYAPEVYDKVMRLAQFVQEVAAARWGSMSVGYRLSDIDPIEVPEELK